MTATVRVRITPAVADDLAAREVADAAEYEGAPNPYRLALDPGTIELDLLEAVELAGDAEWQSEPDGPHAAEFGVRMAYKRLYDSIEQQLAAFDRDVVAAARALRTDSLLAAWNDRPPVDTPPLPPVWYVHDTNGEPTLWCNGDEVCTFVVRRRTVLAVVAGAVVDESPVDEWPLLVARVAARCGGSGRR